jgi:hypothetical protein
MAIQAHLAELEKRHEALEREIQLEMLRPSGDDLKVVTMKRKKLMLKEEIERLRQKSSKPVLH